MEGLLAQKVTGSAAKGGKWIEGDPWDYERGELVLRSTTKFALHSMLIELWPAVSCYQFCNLSIVCLICILLAVNFVMYEMLSLQARYPHTHFQSHDDHFRFQTLYSTLVQ